MNWFYKGLELTSEEYDKLRRQFAGWSIVGLEQRISLHLDEVLYAWAHAIFKLGEGYNTFWPALCKDVFGRSSSEDIMWKRLYHVVSKIVSERYGISEGGTAGLVFRELLVHRWRSKYGEWPSSGEDVAHGARCA